MQWTPSGGFSESADPWLPYGPELGRRNVESQLGDPSSMLELYRRLLRLRHTSTPLREGDYATLPQLHPEVLAYRRTAGDETVYVAINFSGFPERVELPEGGLVLTSTGERAGAVDAVFILGPHEAVIVG